MEYEEIAGRPNSIRQHGICVPPITSAPSASLRRPLLLIFADSIFVDEFVAGDADEDVFEGGFGY